MTRTNLHTMRRIRPDITRCRICCTAIGFGVLSAGSQLQAQATHGQPQIETSDLRTWASLGLGAADHGLVLAQANVWLAYNQFGASIRVTDAETPFAAAGSVIHKRRDEALLVGWRPPLRSDRFSVIISGGLANLHVRDTQGDNRRVVKSVTKLCPTLEGDLGFRITDHFGAGLSVFSAHADAATYLGSALAIRVGRIP